MLCLLSLICLIGMAIAFGFIERRPGEVFRHIDVPVVTYNYMNNTTIPQTILYLRRAYTTMVVVMKSTRRLVFPRARVVIHEILLKQPSRQPVVVGWNPGAVQPRGHLRRRLSHVLDVTLLHAGFVHSRSSFYSLHLLQSQTLVVRGA